MNMIIDGVDYTAEANFIKEHIKELDTAGKSEVSFPTDIVDFHTENHIKAMAFKLTKEDSTFPHFITYDSETDQFTVKLRQNIE